MKSAQSPEQKQIKRILLSRLADILILYFVASQAESDTGFLVLACEFSSGV